MGVHYYDVEYEESVRKALYLWECNHSTYQSIRKEYDKLSKEARQFGIEFAKMPSIAKARWSVIPLLLKESRQDAEEYLRELDDSGIRSVIRSIDLLLDDYGYNTYIAYTKDLRYLLKHHDCKRGYGFDPDYPCTAVPSRSVGSHRVPSLD